jgi:hypothetical protein
MTKSSALVATAVFPVLLFATAMPAQTTDASTPPSGVSKVRIVRLSEVKGAVQVDRNTGRGFEPAMANLPIVEQSRLQTGTGVAEVEFEDNSTLRLAPDSVAEFSQLERRPAGTTISSVHLLKGMAYVSLVKSGGNEFNLLFGSQKLPLPPGSHIRLQMDGTEARVAVLDGALRVDGSTGALDVPRKKTVTFDLMEHNGPAVAKDILPEPLDSWDQTAAGYHSRVANLTGLNGTPYSYGVNDMSYYGSFMDAGGGCGSMWRPYFASAAWDPYSNGAYAYYPGAGYSWVSPYPWGWTPYHTGSWSYCPSAGWGWQPGGGWNGLNNIAAVLPNAGGGQGHLPVAPLRPPRANEPTIMAVNLKPLVRSEVASSQSFVFRRDSAGLGVPRDGLGKLNKLSEQTVQRGTANTPVYLSAPAAATVNGRVTSEGAAMVSVRRGSAPPPSSFSEASSRSGPSSSGNTSSNVSSSASSGHSGSSSSGHSH